MLNEDVVERRKQPSEWIANLVSMVLLRWLRSGVKRLLRKIVRKERMLEWW